MGLENIMPWWKDLLKSVIFENNLKSSENQRVIIWQSFAIRIIWNHGNQWILLIYFLTIFVVI